MGGGFTNAGGLSVNSIARWDGANWDNLAGGLHQAPRGGNNPAPIPSVRALQFIGDRLYVGGYFDVAGGIAATNVAEFSSGTWKALISGTNNGVAGLYNQVHALAANDNGELIVGGEFSQAGDVPANFVAKWTGSKWEALGLGLNRPSDGYVESLYCQGNDIYAGGRFVMLEGVWTDVNHSGFARWNGTNWVTLAVATREGTSGGTIGTTIITGDGTNVFAAAPLVSPVTTGTCIIVAHNDSWSLFGGGGGMAVSSDIHTVTSTGSKIQTSVLAIGSSQAVIEWDGNRWSTVTPALNGRIEKVLYNNGVTYAVGAFSSAASGPALNGIAGWDGTNWFSLGEGLPSAGLSITTNGANIIAGHQTGIRQWNGATWSEMGDGLPGEVRAIAVDNGVIFAGGAFATNGITNIAQWTGASWRPLGLGLNATVRTLAVVDHKLYAGGDFVFADGTTANNIAVWDGASWSELGGGISSGIYATTVYAILPDGVGGIFVAGDFQQTASKPANFIAHWDGGSWETLGSGLTAPALALTIQRENLFVVGNFIFAGGHPSRNIGSYRLSDLSLSPLGISAQASFSLEARGFFPKDYVLQQSSDLNSWTNVATNTFTPPRTQLTAPAGFGTQFYRLADPNR